MKCLVLLAGLLLVSCGKEEVKPQPQAVVTPQTAPEKKAPLPVPQGKLPVMDPEKAKFIAVPNTPKDPEVKKAEKPAGEAQKVEKPVGEAKK
ncbi:MAG: hypothetical protein QE570_18665 [Verrucomicrobiota bacterium]|nr:hypothetical protein [Verrucomicrobiota bacterium]